MVNDAVMCKRVCDMLLEQHDIYVQPINYPTVPVGTERLRITPSPAHSDADIDHFIEALDSVWTALGLERTDSHGDDDALPAIDVGVLRQGQLAAATGARSLHHTAHFTAGLARPAETASGSQGPLARLLARLLPRRAYG
jgi:hypothetical protein